MAIDFPNSPTLNQIFTVGSRSWKWDGIIWAIYSNNPVLYRQDSPPSSPQEGDQWFETDTGRMFVYYGTAWVELGNATDIAGALQPGQITALTAVTTLTSDDVFPVVDNPAGAVATNKITATNLGSQLMQFAPQTSFRNVLINGGFDIWQRALSSASTGITTADRWYNLAAGTTTFSQDSSDYPTGVGVMYSSKWTTGATLSYGQIFQAIESSSVVRLRGSAMTFSVWVKRGASISGSLYFQAFYSTSSDAYGSQTIAITMTNDNIVPTTSWVRYSCNFTVPSNAVGLKVGIAPTNVQASGVVVYFAGMQLERGSVATPFEQRPIGTELALCQRYYFSTDNFSAVASAGIYHSNSFPVVMRARPTVTYSAAGFTTGLIGVNGFYTINGTTTAYNYQAAIEL